MVVAGCGEVAMVVAGYGEVEMVVVGSEVAG